ncbi:MAG TPA: RNA polymerase sigma factor [Oculatellaceae cyanobacterium]|nr:RNA polymerase sigma factor [Cyanobacteria bacterium SZAS LIN-5]
MQGIENVATEMSLMLVAAKQMARRYGQIGVCEPDDIAQNAMLKLLKKRADRLPTLGWLYMAVRCSAIDAGRRASREMRVLHYQLNCNTRVVAEHGKEYSYSPVFTAYSVSEDESEIDLMPRLKGVLDKLSAPLKQVLVLYSEGNSYEEIARLTNTKLGTVRSRLHYARRRAKGLLSGIE